MAMKKYPFLDLAHTNAPYLDELKAAACEVIGRGRYLHGNETELFEQEIARLCQARYCVSVSNGLDFEADFEGLQGNGGDEGW